MEGTPEFHDEPLLPQALDELMSRFGFTAEELGRLIGVSAEAVERSRAENREPEGAGLRGVMLLGVIYSALDFKAEELGSDTAVSAWLAEDMDGEQRRYRLSYATSVDDVGRVLNR